MKRKWKPQITKRTSNVVSFRVTIGYESNLQEERYDGWVTIGEWHGTKQYGDVWSVHHCSKDLKKLRQKLYNEARKMIQTCFLWP